MEKKLPDDNLEEFLRNSFNQYKENPADQVWDRIDNSLNTVSTVPTSFFKKLFYPIAATLVLSTLTYLIYTNRALKNKLDAALSLQHEIMTSPTGAETGQSDLLNTEKMNELNASEADYSAKDEETTKMDAGSLSMESKNGEILNTDGLTQKIKSDLKDSDRSGKSSILTKTKIEKNETVTGLISKPENSSIKKSNGSKLKTNQTNPLYSTNNSIHAAPENSIQGKEERIVKKNNDPLAHNNLTNLIKTNESQENAETNEVAYSPSRAPYLVSNLPFENKEINHTKDNSRFSTKYPFYTNPVPGHGIVADEVSLSAGLIYESGKIENEHGKDLRGTNEFKTNNSWQVGLALNKGITKNLFFSTGIGFKHFDIVNDVSQSISFGNRRPRPGGKPFEHDFPFRLQCSAGSSDIVIRTEQLDQRVSYTDNQPIELKIQTEIELNYLTVPVGLQYRYVKNKFFAGAGLGLNIDILARSSVSNPEVKLLNNILKPIEQPQLSKLGQTQEIVLNSRVNLIAGYTINKDFKIYISPELYVPVSDRTNDRAGKIATNAFGMQAGLTYSLN